MELTVQQTPLDTLVPYARNARTHSDTQVAQIAASIQEFGFVNPVLIGADNVIIAGHGRVLAAQQLGLTTVPTIALVHLNENQRRALVIADNKLAENAGWDEELLRLELQSLVDEDFNIDLLGFDDVDLDALLADIDGDESPVIEEAVPEPQVNPISQLGDVWVLGDHRLICGDATCADTLNALMENELADMVFTDPPYNVNYDDTDKYAKHSHKTKRTILNDNLGDEFEQFLSKACSNLLAYAKGAVYICMSSSELDTLRRAFCNAGGKWSTFIIWAKSTFTLGRSDYQRQYEPILYGWKQGNDHYWCGARDQGDVWFCDKPRKNDVHPTMKPLELVSRAIKNSSKSDDIVLDVFGGSGSTLIAAEQCRRRARLVELDPGYVDVIIQRWQSLTGKEAHHQSSQQTFDALSQQRLQQTVTSCSE